MRVYQGHVLLSDLHFERLSASLNLLHFDVPLHYTREYFNDLIAELCAMNGFSGLARVRLTIFRADGGLYHPVNNTPDFIIQCGELKREVLELNTTGLTLDVFPDVRKSCDKLSNIKSNSALPYVMAAMHARQHQLDEVVVLNPYGRVADTSVANLFIVRNQRLITPPLSEGGVCGVMRKYMLHAELPFKVEEQPLTIADLENADEIFLTNAIYGIRWVGYFRDSSYGNATALILHELLYEGAF